MALNLQSRTARMIVLWSSALEEQILILTHEVGPKQPVMPGSS